MPSNIIMHNGALPLGSLLSSKLKPKPQASLSPEFTHILFFDSTQLLSGILSSHGKIDYAIATCGTKTAISCPERSNNVAIIEWKEGWVDTEGSKLCLNEWVDKPKWSSSNSHAFKKWGNNPAIKWEVNEGNWKATNPQKQTLATFVARRGTLTSRIELTNTGKPYTDALVLTGLLSVAGKKEWKWHNYVEAQRDTVKAGFRDSIDWRRVAGVDHGQLSEEALPSYREAPFTSPLGTLPGYSWQPANRGDELYSHDHFGVASDERASS